jgi:hypothetical protein
MQFSNDEALAARAQDVIFDQPLVSYVDDVLGLPPATMQVGCCDAARSAWAPSATSCHSSFFDPTSLVDQRRGVKEPVFVSGAMPSAPQTMKILCGFAPLRELFSHQ